MRPTTWPTNGVAARRALGRAASTRSASWPPGCIDADPLDVAFVKNTSEGIGVVAEGFPWQPRRQRRARGRGVPGQPVPVDEPRRAAASRCGACRAAAAASRIDDLRAAMDARTRVLAV